MKIEKIKEEGYFHYPENQEIAEKVDQIIDIINSLTEKGGVCGCPTAQLFPHGKDEHGNWCCPQEKLDVQKLLDEYVDCTTELWLEGDKNLSRFAKEQATRRKKEILETLTQALTQ